MPQDATIRHMHVLQMANEDLQEELRDKQDPRSFLGNDQQP